MTSTSLLLGVLAVVTAREHQQSLRANFQSQIRVWKPRTIALKKYCEVWDKEKRDCTTFSSDRQKVHDEIMAKAKKDILEAANVFHDKKQEPIVFCLRGNTASGKSTSIRNGEIPKLTCVKDLVADEKKFAAINVDLYKSKLLNTAKEDFPNAPTKEDVHPDGDEPHTTHIVIQDVHDEALKIKRLLQTWASKETIGGKEPISFIVDARNSNPGDITTFTNLAQTTNRKLAIYDIYCPLRFSLKCVLARPHSANERGFTEPIPDWESVAGNGFKGNMRSRAMFQQLFKDPTAIFKEFTGKDETEKKANAEKFKASGIAVEYLLLDTKDDFTKVVVLEITNGGEKVNDAEAIKKIASMADGTDEVAAVEKEEVNYKVCEKLKEKYKKECEKLLCGWLGNTWHQAIDMHQKGTAPPKASTDECKNL